MQAKLKTLAIIEAVKKEGPLKLLELCDRFENVCFDSLANFQTILKSLGIRQLSTQTITIVRSDLVTFEERKELLKAIIYGYGRRYKLSTFGDNSVRTYGLPGPDLMDDVMILEITIDRKVFLFCYVPIKGIQFSENHLTTLVKYIVKKLRSKLKDDMEDLEKDYTFTIQSETGGEQADEVEGQGKDIRNTIRFVIENLVDVTSSTALIITFGAEKEIALSFLFRSGNVNRVEVEEFRTVEEYRDLLLTNQGPASLERYDIHTLAEWKNYAIAMENNLFYGYMLNENFTATMQGFVFNSKSKSERMKGLLPNVGSKIVKLVIDENHRLAKVTKLFVYDESGKMSTMRTVGMAILKSVANVLANQEHEGLKGFTYSSDHSVGDFIDTTSQQGLTLQAQKDQRPDLIDLLLQDSNVKQFEFVAQGRREKFKVVVKLSTYTYTHDDPGK